MRVELLGMDFHRNGVSGEGFHVAYIKMDGENLTAIVPGNLDDIAPEDECANLHRVYVVNPDHPEEHYRGDYIGAELLPMMRATLLSGPIPF